MDKNKDILKYSNPTIVQQRANQLLDNKTKVYISNLKNKKYYVINPEGKKIHFGQIPYLDFTKTQDQEKRRLFRLRNKAWAKANKWSPAWLSYNLLW